LAKAFNVRWIAQALSYWIRQDLTLQAIIHKNGIPGARDSVNGVLLVLLLKVFDNIRGMGNASEIGIGGSHCG
jgi:hypothetical protein